MSSCACLCGLLHRSENVCESEPVTTRRFTVHGTPTDLPFCGPCAESLDRQRAEFVRTTG